MNNTGILDIGFDDTDSPSGMCTTFLAYKMVSEIKSRGAEFPDFPRLVRFNPNIPWKTRGNGAVSIKIRTLDVAGTKNMVRRMVEKYSDVENGANPGVVFFDGKNMPDSFSKFSNLALWQLVSRSKARKFAVENGLDVFYMGNGQGLVGAIGAVGYTFGDHTFELLSYRKRRNFGKRRKISAQSVQQAHRDNPGTFNSFDEENRRVLVAPHGPDPVFYGIRGEDVRSILHAAKTVMTEEKLDGHMIFKSNQGTGDHLKNRLAFEDMSPYTSGMLTGAVCDLPETGRGGHVFFTISFGNHKFRCAVYKPTGMTSIARELIRGDNICVGGGIRKASKNFSRVFNVEFIKILKLEKRISIVNPFCIRCSKSMKSKGVGQGYQCIKCEMKSPRKHTVIVPRKIRRQLYLPVVSAHRHLTRPMKRIGRKNTKSEFGESIPWICQYE